MTIADVDSPEADAMRVETIMQTPVLMAARWECQPTTVADQPAIVISIQRPTDTARVVLLRDDALRLASDIRKQANTGPQLVMPPSGLVVAR
jgi:hypothetical protein